MRLPLPHFVLFTLLSVVGLSTAAEPPNFLFIFADDQAPDTIRALGNDEIHTPNLDTLVANGTTFTRAYNSGAWGGAVCMASRMMLVTGRQLWHAHKDYPKTDEYQKNNKTWPQLLASGKGYETYFSGKWHVKMDANKAFTHCTNVRPGMPNQTKQGYNRPIDGQEDVWSPYDPTFEGFWKGGTHWSEVLGNDAVQYLSMAQKSKAPFFMYLAFNAPHDPRQAPKEFVDMYPSKDIKVPESFLPIYPHCEGMGAGKGLRDEKLAPFPRTEHAIQVNRQEYYAIITHLDTQVGRMLDALKATGKKDNTYIFFTADHGLGCGHHGLLGKQNMYDHSVRVPWIINGPGIEAGKKIDTPIYLQDVMATTFDLAGMDKPEQVQFDSVMPKLRGEDSGDRPIYGGYTMTQRMVTAEGYKLILYPKIKVKRLYHIAEDPLELTDLASNPDADKRMKTLFSEFLELQKTMGDPLDVASLYPELL